ncbi:MAG: hypothetical protein HC912_12955 [Saprospiraceae bacterium]|nr:hypothetical protein [Saprospiraceae bacterium]
MKQNKYLYSTIITIGTILVMLCMILLLLFPSEFVIFASGIVIPVIIVGIAYWILRAKAEPNSTKQDDWYEN